MPGMVAPVGSVGGYLAKLGGYLTSSTKIVKFINSYLPAVIQAIQVCLKLSLQLRPRHFDWSHHLCQYLHHICSVPCQPEASQPYVLIRGQSDVYWWNWEICHSKSVVNNYTRLREVGYAMIF